MEIKNLDFSFSKGKSSDNKDLLFQALSLKIEPQKLTVFLGPSGCGKSTLLRILAGLQNVDPRFYLYQDLKASFVFQEANLLEWKSVAKNIMLPFLLLRKTPPVELFNEIVSLLNISDCLSKFPSELSGGQKMRVSIARALITEPHVLFMDEPFSALDEPTRLNLQEELKIIQRKLKMTILFVTHSFYEAVFLGDRVLVFSGSKPSSFMFDENKQQEFKDRFDPAYLSKVQDISKYFLGPKVEP